ncbi:MAG TPA: META domain-containing protein [Sphingomonas sp.]|jgi:uncharacterized membrane protein|nr:META domain-containing protein [Sphingomonas sp.]
MKRLVAPLLLSLAATAGAQTRDKPYRAVGTEPFWGLSIDGATMRLDRPNVSPVIAAAPVPRRIPNGRRYDSPVVTVDISGMPCGDGMSDRRYPESVTVTLARRVFRGCGGASLEEPIGRQSLEGATWGIFAIDGRPVAVDGARLRFDGANITGTAGCNSFSAPYLLDGDHPRVGLVMATQMGCPGPGMVAEKAVRAAFSRPLRLRWLGRGALLLETG